MSTTTEPTPIGLAAQDELDGMPERVELVPKIDGRTVDKIELVFTGRIALDVNEPADAELFNRLQMGQEIELNLGMSVAGTPHAITFDAEGFVKNLTGRRRLRVHSLELPHER